MTILVAIVLAGLVFGLIAYPLLRQGSRRSRAQPAEDEELQELRSKRDATYSAIKELEFDFQAGSLSQEDYRELVASYQKKAISILRDIDEQEKGSKVEDEIEKQVQELRRARGPFCSQCGARCQAGDRFCSQCGTSLVRGRPD